MKRHLLTTVILILATLLMLSYFYQPIDRSGKYERMLSDNYLNALVRSKVTYGAVNILFGPPVFERQSGDLVEAHYAMGAKYPTFRDRSGRVGFTAVYRNGIIVEWAEVTQDLNRQSAGKDVRSKGADDMKAKEKSDL